MKKIGTILAVGMGMAFVSASAYAQLGISAKAKAGKVQGNLVPAYYPQSSGSGTGDDENDSPAFLATAVQRSTNCTFDQGKFKAQVGKDAAVQLKGVTCGGMPFSGTLCAHTKQVATIMNEDIDKKGVLTGKTCLSGATHLEGKMNFSTGNVGTLTCSAGSCKGTLPVVTADPCTDVDKVSELRRLEVFDGSLTGSGTILGTVLKTCCGPTQVFVGSLGQNNSLGGTNNNACASSDNDELHGGAQDVLGEIGTITQGQ